jgi:hypothetical protein
MPTATITSRGVRTKDPNLKLDNGDHVLLVEHIGSEYLAIAADPKLIA